MRSLLVLLLVSMSLVAAGPVLQFTGPSGGTAKRAVALPNGGALIIGTENRFGEPGATSLPSMRVAASLVNLPNAQDDPVSLPAAAQLGHGNDIPADAAVDRNGNIWVVGTTDSDDFPLVSPLIRQKAAYQATGFAIKLDPTGSKILFSTFLGGAQPNGSSAGPVSSSATNIALDPAGNAYILGNTTDSSFPVTSGVLGTGGPHVDSFGRSTYSFAVKISPDGARLVYSTLIGADRVDCVGGSHCLGKYGQTVGDAIAVDDGGSVTIAGSTNAANFPVTANAFQKTCLCPDVSQDGFVARLSPAGAGLTWATYLGGTQDTNGRSGSSVAAIALDTSGNVYAAGTTFGMFPTTSGVVQSSVPPVVSGPNVFVAKLRADGSALIYGTYLGGANGAQLAGVALDAAGNLWIAGTTNSPDFPSVRGVAPLGNDFALELNANASALTQLYRLPAGTVMQPPAFDSNGNLLLLASRGALVRLAPSDGLSGAGLLSVANAASLDAVAGVSPGELVTIFGVGLGPDPGITGATDASRVFTTELGGVQVFFGAQPAPLLYAGPNQINLQVPFEFGFPYTMQVVTPTAKLPPVRVNPLPSLGIFHQANSSVAAALNQDGTVNSASDPAKPGSIVSLFVTGLPGRFGMKDGALAPGPDPYSVFSLNIRVAPFPSQGSLPILYAGAAPGLINGAAQINVLLPPEVRDPLLTLSQDTGSITLSSNAVQVYAH